MFKLIMPWNSAKHINYVAFLEGRGVNNHKQTINQVLNLSDDELERQHDYIQSVFPLTEQSAAINLAPLTEDELDQLQASVTAKDNVCKMYHRMLAFWKLDGDLFLQWDNVERHWNQPNNHNFRRMTRVYKSLELLQMEPERRDFQNRMQYLLHQPACQISESTRLIWEQLLQNIN